MQRLRRLLANDKNAGFKMFKKSAMKRFCQKGNAFKMFVSI